MCVLKLGWAGARLLFLSPWSPGGTHVDVKPSPDDAWASGRQRLEWRMKECATTIVPGHTCVTVSPCVCACAPHVLVICDVRARGVCVCVIRVRRLYVSVCRVCSALCRDRDAVLFVCVSWGRVGIVDGWEGDWEDVHNAPHPLGPQP